MKSMPKIQNKVIFNLGEMRKSQRGTKLFLILPKNMRCLNHNLEINASSFYCAPTLCLGSPLVIFFFFNYNMVIELFEPVVLNTGKQFAISLYFSIYSN